MVSLWNCDAGGVSKWGTDPRVSPRADLCQGESGSGASLGAIIVMSDRTFAEFPSNEFDGVGAFSDDATFRGELLCAEQE